MTSLYSSVLSHNLRVLRKERGRTQEEMARDCRISYRLYQKLEAGRANPTLDSINRIARSVLVPLDDLLRLKRLEIAGTREQFLGRLKDRLDDSKLAVGVHTPEGVALWGNRRMAEIHGVAPQAVPFDLLEWLQPAARETLKYQTSCERLGVVQPYINSTRTQSGESVYRQYYPTIISPRHDPASQFNVVYAAESRRDAQNDYLEFCRELLGCVGEPA